MNSTVKVERKEQGKLITKEISSELLPMYLATGWIKHEEKKPYKVMQPRVENNE